MRVYSVGIFIQVKNVYEFRLILLIYISGNFSISVGELTYDLSKEGSLVLIDIASLILLHR